MKEKTTDLNVYLTGVLRERNLSIRGLAMYAGLSHATVRRMMLGQPVEYESLQKLAAYLNVPEEILFRLAGILPGEHDLSGMQRTVQFLFEQLCPDNQAEVLDIIRMKLQRQKIDPH